MRASGSDQSFLRGSDFPDKPQPAARRNMIVRFDESLNTHTIFADIAPREDCWYTKDDYRRFRAAFNKTLRRVRAKDSAENRSRSTILKSVFESLCRADLSSKDEGESTVSSSIMREQEEEELIRLYMISDEQEEQGDNDLDLLLGLETDLVPSIGHNLDVRREVLQEKVHDLQADFDPALDDADSVAEELRAYSRHATAPARLWAQALARARMVAQ